MSHDVHFIRAIAKHTIQIETGKITPYAGDYDYYLRKSGAMSEQGGLVAGLKNASPEATKKPEEKTKVINAKERRRAGAEKRKIESANRRKIGKRVAKLESEILALEEEQSEITKLLENPDSYSDPDKAKELNIKAARLAKKLSEKNYEWDIETENLLQINEDS